MKRLQDAASLDEPLITRSGAYQLESYGGIKLWWGISGSLGNSNRMTVGWSLLEPGEGTSRHYHPNCDEALVVVAGHIMHSWNSREVEMEEGDMISLPQGVVHNARNIGEEQARLLICYSSADRKVVSVN